MKITKTLACFLMIALPVCFMACSSDDDDDNVINGGGTDEPQETILLSSAAINHEAGRDVGFRFSYDSNKNVSEAYDYYLEEDAITHEMDTTDYKKYVFDRSVQGITSVKTYKYNDSQKSWIDNKEEMKIVYSGSKINKIELYSGGSLNNTEVFTWEGDKLIRREGKSIADTAKYVNGNYIDSDPEISETPLETGYIKFTHSYFSTFSSHKNFLSIVPVEYAMISRYRNDMFPIHEYFSDNGLDKTGWTIVMESNKADKTTKLLKATQTQTKNYEYSFGDVTDLYPSVVKKTSTLKDSFIDYEDETQNYTDKEIMKMETTMNFTLVKK